MADTIFAIWSLVEQERAVTAALTTRVSDYALVSRWLKECPVQDPTRMREALVWVLAHEQDTAKRKVATYLRACARYAHEVLHLLPSNPLATFRMPKKAQAAAEVVVIPRLELAAVFEALQDGKKGTRDWEPYVEFMLQTGVRTGELFGLQWGDVDRVDKRVLVQRNMTVCGMKNSTKTQKARWVPLNAAAYKALNRMSSTTALIFPGSREAYRSFFMDRMTKAHRAGVISRVYRPYDLRHTAISRWLEAGIPVAQVARWAGNSNQVIMAHYCNHTQDYAIPVI